MRRERDARRNKNKMAASDRMQIGSTEFVCDLQMERGRQGRWQQNMIDLLSASSLVDLKCLLPAWIQTACTPATRTTHPLSSWS